jgi:hypothetical protein
MYPDGFATRIGPVITNEGRVMGLSLVRLTPRRPKCESVADAAVELADMIRHRSDRDRRTWLKRGAAADHDTAR